MTKSFFAGIWRRLFGHRDTDFLDWHNVKISGLSPASVKALKDWLMLIERADLSLFSTQQLKDIQIMVNQLRFFMPALAINAPLIDLVRVTKNPRDADGIGSRINQISRLKYPPQGKCKIEMGRANFPDSSVLYASFFGLTSLVEMRIAPGDLVTRTEWRMVTYLDKINSMCVFHDNRILERLPGFKEYNESYLAVRAKRPTLEAEAVDAVSTFIARQFTKPVPPDKKTNYLISAFVSDMWLNQNKLDAIIYPSVQTDLNDVCVAMRPDVFDHMFYPVRCREMLVVREGYLETTGWATEFDTETGAINWDEKKSFDEVNLREFQKQRARERVLG
jgi:RES domain